MRRLFSSPDSAQIGLCRSRLEAAGIPCEVRNEYLSPAMPGTPFDPELWVLNDAQFAEASELLATWRQPAPPQNEKPQCSSFTFAPLSPQDRNKKWVTLLTCPTLILANTAVSRLGAAGIPTHIPDDNLNWAQVMASNLQGLSYVRVQVAPDDYQRARDLFGLKHPRLTASGCGKSGGADSSIQGR